MAWLAHPVGRSSRTPCRRYGTWTPAGVRALARRWRLTQHQRVVSAHRLVITHDGRVPRPESAARASDHRHGAGMKRLIRRAQPHRQAQIIAEFWFTSQPPSPPSTPSSTKPACAPPARPGAGPGTARADAGVHPRDALAHPRPGRRVQAHRLGDESDQRHQGDDRDSAGSSSFLRRPAGGSCGSSRVDIRASRAAVKWPTLSGPSWALP